MYFATMAASSPAPAAKARGPIPPSVASKSLEELQQLFVDVRKKGGWVGE